MTYMAWALFGSLAIATLIIVVIMAFVPDEQDRQYR